MLVKISNVRGCVFRVRLHRERGHRCRNTELRVWMSWRKQGRTFDPVNTMLPKCRALRYAKLMTFLLFAVHLCFSLAIVAGVQFAYDGDLHVALSCFLMYWAGVFFGAARRRKNDYENEHLNCVCHRIHHRRSSNRIFASGEIMIRVIQCLCKRQHCIMGMAYDPRTKPSNDAMFQFRVLVESSVQRNYFPSECALCKCPSDDWHYIDMNTEIQHTGRGTSGVRTLRNP
jgi:hypothetical protein